MSKAVVKSAAGTMLLCQTWPTVGGWWMVSVVIMMRGIRDAANLRTNNQPLDNNCLHI